MKTLYVDLDGVLFDFVKAVVDITGVRPEDMQDKLLWDTILAEYQTGRQFFRELELMSDALELWDGIQQLGYKPMILTSVGSKIESTLAEKIAACAEHFPEALVIGVNHSYQKSLYAHGDAILIDDRAKSIDPWVRVGGWGILHTSAKDTLRILKGGI